MTPRVLCVLACLALLGAALLPLASATVCDSSAQCIPGDSCSTVDGQTGTCAWPGEAGGAGQACLYTVGNPTQCNNADLFCDERAAGAFKCATVCTDDDGCSNGDKCVTTDGSTKFCSAASAAGSVGSTCYVDSTCDGALTCDTSSYTCATQACTSDSQCDNANTGHVCSGTSAATGDKYCRTAAEAGGLSQPCLFNDPDFSCSAGLVCDTTGSAYTCQQQTCAADAECTDPSAPKCATKDGTSTGVCVAAADVGAQGKACAVDLTCDGTLECNVAEYKCEACNNFGCYSNLERCGTSDNANFACSATTGQENGPCILDTEELICGEQGLWCDTRTEGAYKCIPTPSCNVAPGVCTNGQVCSTTDNSTFTCAEPTDVGGANDACKADLSCDAGFQCISQTPGGALSCLTTCTTSADCPESGSQNCAMLSQDIFTCMYSDESGRPGQPCFIEQGVPQCNTIELSCNTTTLKCGWATCNLVPQLCTLEEGQNQKCTTTDDVTFTCVEPDTIGGEGESCIVNGNDKSCDEGLGLECINNECVVPPTPSPSSSSSTGSGASGSTGSSTGGDSDSGSTGSGETGSQTGGNTGGDTGSATGETGSGSTGSQDECPDACLDGTTCVNGECVATVKECTPACNQTLGQVCDTRVGQCTSQADLICLDCTNAGGVCERSSFAGVMPICLQRVDGAPSSCAFDADCANTTTGSICRSSQCVPCTGSCLALLNSPASSGFNGSAIIGLLYQSGLDPNSVNVVPGSLAINNGAVTVGAGSLVTLASTDAAVSQLTLAGSTPGAVLITGQRSIGQLQSSSQGNSLMISGGLQADNVQVSQGGSLTMSMPAGSASTLNLSAITLSGPLNLVASAGSVINFPSAANGVSVNGGSVSISGNGAGVTGNLGSAPLTLAPTNGVPASIQTPPGDKLALSGDVLGVGASIDAAGEVDVSSLKLEPNVNVAPGGQLSLNTSAASATSQQTTGDISLGSTVAPSSVASRSLLAASQSVLTVSGNGANLQLGKLASCPSTATIRYSVTGLPQAAIDAGITVFNYASSTNAASAAFTCAIEVCGTEGGCVAVTNPKVASGRRLLATAGGDAEWQATKLVIKSKTGNPGNSAAAMAAQPIMLLALAFAAIVAVLRM